MDFTLFQRNLNALIQGHGYSLKDISTELGIVPSTLSRYISGARIPELSYVIKLATYFDVSIDWLLGLTDNRNGDFSPEIIDILNAYISATPDDQRVVQAALNKYREEK